MKKWKKKDFRGQRLASAIKNQVYIIHSRISVVLHVGITVELVQLKMLWVLIEMDNIFIPEMRKSSFSDDEVN